MIGTFPFDTTSVFAVFEALPVVGDMRVIHSSPFFQQQA